jgi:hypothetical protein
MDTAIEAMTGDQRARILARQSSLGADRREVPLTATKALRRVGVEHTTLQLESGPCGQGRPIGIPRLTKE